MKKLIPFIFAFASPCYADVSHSLQSVVSVSTLGASATSSRIGSSISVAGTNVTPTANTIENAIGSLDLSDDGISSGVPTVDYDTSFAVTTPGDSFSVSETYLEADPVNSLLSGTVTDGVVTELPLFGVNTTYSGGDPGSVTISLDSGQALSVDLTDMGSGSTATLQHTITLDLE